jgi:hypothetical protein
MGRAYPDDDAGRNDPLRSGIDQHCPTTMRVGTCHFAAAVLIQPFSTIIPGMKKL